MTDEKLLDINEVAAILAVSTRALWQWAADGKFPQAIQLGRLRRWRRADVEGWLASQAANATKDRPEGRGQ